VSFWKDTDQFDSILGGTTTQLQGTVETRRSADPYDLCVTPPLLDTVKHLHYFHETSVANMNRQCRSPFTVASMARGAFGYCFYLMKSNPTDAVASFRLPSNPMSTTKNAVLRQTPSQKKV
jgi:hypothetical protein